MEYLKNELKHNAIVTIDEISVETASIGKYFGSPRSSRSSKSTMSPSSISQIKQKEKEMLDNQALLQEVKYRYEYLASKSSHKIVCKILEKMKSLDLSTFSFNDPLLSFILDMDQINPKLVVYFQILN
nr:14668_t:CDS:2 [Entrophospora candida]